MGQVANIIQGHVNELFPDDRIEEIAKNRLEVCGKCKARVLSKRLGLRCSPKQSMIHAITGDKVKGCGCRLEAKVRVPNDECPAGKWLPEFE